MSILIGVVVVVLFGAVLLAVVTRKKGGGGKKGKQKGRSQIIRDATRKLSQDPHNPDALVSLGDLYYTERVWDKAFPLYETMVSIAPAHREIEPFKASLRYGICASKLNKIPEAIRGLNAAYALDKHNFEVNYYLGMASFKNNEFDKARGFFKNSAILRPDAPNLNKYLGLSLYKGKHYKESLQYLKKALDENPENKEMLFSMADAMNEGGYSDKAMKVFMHLRFDPEFGAKSCLAAGMYHMKLNQAEKAIQDFEIAFKHQNVDQDTMLEIRYRHATSCFMMNSIAKGLESLRAINSVNPAYKDVPTLLARYQELNKNKNLQTYLMASSSDFVSLCRRIIVANYKKGMAKIVDIAVNQDNVEMIVDADYIRSVETHVYKFFRSTGVISDFLVRDFHGKISERKADKGLLVTAGTFSDEARRFAEGRPLELYEKDTLIKLLKKVDS